MSAGLHRPFRRAMRVAVPVLLAAAGGCSSDTSGPSVPPANLTLAAIDSGYDFPIQVIAPPGDTSRLMVLERGGRVVLRKNGVRLDSAFVNLTGLTGVPGVAREYGVLSIAFHPQYATNRRLFAYLIDQNEDTRLIELTAAPRLRSRQPPVPVRTILQFSQPSYAIHYGGTVTFGKDGMLYLATGDGETGAVLTSPGAGQHLAPRQDAAHRRGRRDAVRHSRRQSLRRPSGMAW